MSKMRRKRGILETWTETSGRRMCSKQKPKHASSRLASLRSRENCYARCYFVICCRRRCPPFYLRIVNHRFVRLVRLKRNGQRFATTSNEKWSNFVRAENEAAAKGADTEAPPFSGHNRFRIFLRRFSFRFRFCFWAQLAPEFDCYHFVNVYSLRLMFGSALAESQVHAHTHRSPARPPLLRATHFDLERNEN